MAAIALRLSFVRVLMQSTCSFCLASDAITEAFSSYDSLCVFKITLTNKSPGSFLNLTILK